MLGAWCLGTVGGCWQRDACAYYVQDVWTRVTEANEELVWDMPASVHVMFTWALGTRVLCKGSSHGLCDSTERHKGNAPCARPR